RPRLEFDACPLCGPFGRIVSEVSHDRAERRAAAGDGSGPARADHRSLDARCLRPGPGRGVRASGGSTPATRGAAPSGDPAHDPPLATGVLAGPPRTAHGPTESSEVGSAPPRGPPGQ